MQLRRKTLQRIALGSSFVIAVGKDVTESMLAAKKKQSKRVQESLLAGDRDKENRDFNKITEQSMIEEVHRVSANESIYEVEVKQTRSQSHEPCNGAPKESSSIAYTPYEALRNRGHSPAQRPPIFSMEKDKDQFESHKRSMGAGSGQK